MVIITSLPWFDFLLCYSTLPCRSTLQLIPQYPLGQQTLERQEAIMPATGTLMMMMMMMMMMNRLVAIGEVVMMMVKGLSSPHRMK